MSDQREHHDDQGGPAAADDTHDIVERVLEFADELEASGDASVTGNAVEKARAVLHQWVDSAVGFVATPAFGRVTVIHPNGRQSTIASPTLPFAMAEPLSGADAGG